MRQTLAPSALDRLANAGYQIVVDGESYRQRLSPHRALLEQKEAGAAPTAHLYPTIYRPLSWSSDCGDEWSKDPGYRHLDCGPALLNPYRTGASVSELLLVDDQYSESMDLLALVRRILGQVVCLRLRTVLLIAVAPMAALFVYALGRSLDKSLGYDLSGPGAVVLDTLIVFFPENRLLILAGAPFAYSFIGAAF